MKSTLIGRTVTTNEENVRLRIFDGDLPLDEAGKELLERERQRAESYLREKLDEQQRYGKRLAEVEADVAFLANRQTRGGCFDGSAERSWGLSSNSLVAYAYGCGEIEMPFDWSDYAACVRVTRRMPRHRRTRSVLNALRAQKAAVDKRYSARERRTENSKQRSAP